MNKDKILGGLFGQGVGDALGVPVEFKKRSWLRENPVKDYLGYLCWNQPPGTFFDDSSMMYCTAESLADEYSIKDIASKFVKWYKEGYWGAHDKLFDIGGTTRRSLERVYKGENPLYSGEFFPENNGNGSLMRILPLIFYLEHEKSVNKRYQIIKEVSSITHAHFRSIFSCFIFVEYGRLLIQGGSKMDAYAEMQSIVKSYANKEGFNKQETDLFSRILEGNISKVPEEEISSLGYVLDSLESSLFCFLNTNSYSESVLNSVNLGGDTDTTAAINGGLAGLYYGFDQIPAKWIKGLAKTDKIDSLGNSLLNALMKLKETT